MMQVAQLYLYLAATDLESYPSDGTLAGNYLVLQELFKDYLTAAPHAPMKKNSNPSQQNWRKVV